MWQLRDGMTSCYREHFDSQHHQLWKQICKNLSLKTRHRAHHSIGGDQKVFSVEMFHHLLLCWVTVDDQVCSQADSELDLDTDLMVRLCTELQCLGMPRVSRASPVPW